MSSSSRGSRHISLDTNNDLIYSNCFLHKGLQVSTHACCSCSIHDMEAKTLVMELRRRTIKRRVPCGDMDRRLKIPHSAKVECGFRTTPEEWLYDSGPIGPSV